MWALTAVCVIFMLCPLGLGILRLYWRFMWDTDDDIVTVFHYFSEKAVYIRTVKFVCALFLKLFYTGFLLLLPSFITEFFSTDRVYGWIGISMPSWATNLYLVSVFLRSAAIVLLVVLSIKYYLAPFFFIANEEMDVFEAIHRSTVISKATSMDFVLLVFSFLGWIILSVTVMPLPFTLPYFAVSYLVHSRFATAGYNKVVEEYNGTVTVEQTD